ncbi:MAG: hybrid sensor histidine kinase/response regulator, partial [Magnetococcales bacterium]|nr:hybrid sensor histidine kinase/response regulator [Magnetococcales bacterium]
IVDDERFNINVLVDVLKPDYTTVVAKNGETALKRVRSETPPDLILLDIMMPDMDGYEVCRQLKADERTRDIPIIFVTAMAETSAETYGLELGAVDYITKPVSPAIVRARVKTHLKLRASHQALVAANQQLEQQNIELIEADKLKQQVDMISRHDLKSPLNGVIGYTDLLLADPTLSTEQKKKLQIVRNGGFNALHIVNLSLGLYRMERGNYQLDPKDIDLLPLIRNVEADSISWLSHNQLKLDIRVNDQPATEADHFFVRGEEVLCYSMLANLIKNALEASPHGATVTVAVAVVSDQMAQIRIHNQGAVPEPIRERFFEKYTTSGKKSGTGLGTYSAKLITETLGGSIQMRSSDAEGTEIIITLPPGKHPVTAAVFRAPERIKVVEPTRAARTPQPAVAAEPIHANIKTIVKMVSLFVHEAPQQLQTLQQALVDQESSRATGAIEWLRKNAVSIGAARVVSQAIRLNGEIEMEDWQQAQGVYPKLARELRVALQALTE